MLWRLFHREGPDKAILFRRVHERWLTRALAGGRAYPRIPLRPVAERGFAPLLARPGGRERAERWWALALERVDLDE